MDAIQFMKPGFKFPKAFVKSYIPYIESLSTGSTQAIHIAANNPKKERATLNVGLLLAMAFGAENHESYAFWMGKDVPDGNISAFMQVEDDDVTYEFGYVPSTSTILSSSSYETSKGGMSQGILKKTLWFLTMIEGAKHPEIGAIVNRFLGKKALDETDADAIYVLSDHMYWSEEKGNEFVVMSHDEMVSSFAKDIDLMVNQGSLDWPEDVQEYLDGLSKPTSSEEEEERFMPSIAVDETAYASLRLKEAKAIASHALSDVPPLKGFYVEQKVLDLAQQVKAGIEEGIGWPNNILLFGPAGNGKSTMAKVLAGLLGVPYRFFNVSLNADEQKLTGDFLPQEGGGFRFRSNTPLLEAARHGGIIEIMEINYARPGVMGVLNAFMDDTSAIEDSSGVIVKRHPACIIVATTNDGYTGTMPMNEALADRFHIKAEIPPLSKEKIIAKMKRVAPRLSDADFDKMYDVVAVISAKMEKDGLVGTVGTRQLLNWAADANFHRDLMTSAMETIIPSISLNKETRAEFVTTCLQPLIKGGKKK